MTLNGWVRAVHRWVSIGFVVLVAVITALTATGTPAQWVYLLPLGPLAVMAATGVWMFALPYLRRAA